MKLSQIVLKNGEIGLFQETDKKKLLKSNDYNFVFDKQTGFFARWGKTQ